MGILVVGPIDVLLVLNLNVLDAIGFAPRCSSSQYRDLILQPVIYTFDLHIFLQKLLHGFAAFGRL